MSSSCSLRRCSYDNVGTVRELRLLDLPTELLVEIFSILPQEPLLQLRCVSKLVHSIIGNYLLPRLAASAHISGLLFRSIKYKRAEKEYPRWVKRMAERRIRKERKPGHYFHHLRTSGSFPRHLYDRSYPHSIFPFKCNINLFLGCFNGFMVYGKDFRFPTEYCVFNPATKQSIRIPINPMHMELESFVGLAFDNILDDPNSPRDFKLVRIARCPSVAALSHPPELDIFSSSTGKWINHSVRFEEEDNFNVVLGFKLKSHSVYVDGVFYMLSLARYLLCFDLRPDDDDELNARAIQLPHVSMDSDNYLGVFEASNERLYYACRTGFELLVWTFQPSEEVSPWLLKYKFNSLELSHIQEGHCLSFEHCLIFAVDLSAEIMYFGHRSRVYKYDIKNIQLKQLWDTENEFIVHATSCFYPFSCSLVRLSSQF